MCCSCLSPASTHAAQCLAVYLALRGAASQARELYRALRHDVPGAARLLVWAHWEQLTQQADAAYATYQQAYAAAYPPVPAPLIVSDNRGRPGYISDQEYEAHLARTDERWQ